ncbi:hypothetical protein BDA96_03G147900 [Sorghum bicolor]|uniref:Uncharacterized protein n=2 Tax=Sorghum bicolor TaxID=4558 RepID=A0A921UM98_SORBI|nr:hypothetical protein BDA96_03G147900 [Sorghum bicolor]OQU86761.1 hypothetical protein SORBI_3003G141050 [Sorghum bicolor]
MNCLPSQKTNRCPLEKWGEKSTGEREQANCRSKVS